MISPPALRRSWGEEARLSARGSRGVSALTCPIETLLSWQARVRGYKTDLPRMRACDSPVPTSLFHGHNTPLQEAQEKRGHSDVPATYLARPPPCLPSPFKYTHREGPDDLRSISSNIGQYSDEPTPDWSNIRMSCYKPSYGAWAQLWGLGTALTTTRRRGTRKGGRAVLHHRARSLSASQSRGIDWPSHRTTRSPIQGTTREGLVARDALRSLRQERLRRVR